MRNGVCSRLADSAPLSRIFSSMSELKRDGGTRSGVPVYVQLLGSDPALAANAKSASQLGALGIDLNFGCPARTVNKSEGGAVLLRRPALLGQICQQVREAVPASTPVTAKVRLGFDDDREFEEVIASLSDTGIDELVVHARTRRQGYRPPAHWHRLRAAVESLDIPVIANGELWSPSDVTQCLAASGAQDIMLAQASCAGLTSQQR